MNLAIVKSGNNKRLYIQKSFRKNGNSSSKNIESLGILSELMKSMNMSEEEVLAWGRKKAKEYTDAEVKENNDVIVKMSSKSLIKKDNSYMLRRSVQDLGKREAQECYLP